MVTCKQNIAQCTFKSTTTNLQINVTFARKAYYYVNKLPSIDVLFETQKEMPGSGANYRELLYYD